MAVGLGPERGRTPEDGLQASVVWPWGSAWPPQPGDGNYAPELEADKFIDTSPVGSFKPNAHGLYVAMYRDYAGREKDPDSVEAIRLWDAGSRVVNTNDFERRWIINKFGKDGRGMRIVLRGTNRTVFRYTGRGTPWWNDNTLGIQHIFPAGAIGLDSAPAELEICRNTIDAMNRWTDRGGSCSYAAARA